MKVFISHSSVDKKFVRYLKNCLQENSIQTWFDEDQLNLGDSLKSKLDEALSDSSHLIVILSPASLKSDWVEYELDLALKNENSGLMSKVIPVKYKKCDVPEKLSERLYGDLSSEIVLPNGNEVRFLSNGFDKFFVQLVSAIRNSQNQLSEEDKTNIKNTLEGKENNSKSYDRHIHRGNYRIIGFATKETKKVYQSRVRRQLNAKLTLNDIHSVLLPRSLEDTWKDLEIGTVITFSDTNQREYRGYFSGFRNDDLNIVLDALLRIKLNLDTYGIYEVEINSKENSVYIFDKLDATPNLT